MDPYIGTLVTSSTAPIRRPDRRTGSAIQSATLTVKGPVTWITAVSSVIYAIIFLIDTTMSNYDYYFNYEILFPTDLLSSFPTRMIDSSMVGSAALPRPVFTIVLF